MQMRMYMENSVCVYIYIHTYACSNDYVTLPNSLRALKIARSVECSSCIAVGGFRLLALGAM